MDKEEFYNQVRDCLRDMNYITMNLQDSLSRMELAYQEKTGKKLPVDLVTSPLSRFNTLSMGNLGMRGEFNFYCMYPSARSMHDAVRTVEMLINGSLPKLTTLAHEMRSALNELTKTYETDTGLPDASNGISHIIQLEKYLERMNTRHSNLYMQNKAVLDTPEYTSPIDEYGIPHY